MVQLKCHKFYLKMIFKSFGEDLGLARVGDHFKKLYGFFYAQKQGKQLMGHRKHGKIQPTGSCIKEND